MPRFLLEQYTVLINNYLLLLNVTYCFEEILEAEPYKTAAVRPPTNHLIKHLSKKNETCGALPGK